MTNRVLAVATLIVALVLPARAGLVGVTQSSSTTIQPLNSVSCNDGSGHTENSYYRAFDLATDPGVAFDVTGVDFGIETAASPGAVGQQVTVRLYVSSTNPPTVASIGAPLASVDVPVADGSAFPVSVPISASLEASEILVVEVLTPDGTAADNLIFIGSNNLGQTAPCYIRAPACGVSEITSLAAVGFPGMQIVMTVHGTTRAPDAPPMCTASGATFSNAIATAITDVGVTTSTITVSGVDPHLFDLNVRTFIQHTFNADLDVTLTSPAGTVVTLTTDNGGGNDNVFNGTLWDDDANPAGQVPYGANIGVVTDSTYVNNVLMSVLVPEEALGAFIGEDPNGVWTLTISDDLAGETGTLNEWSLEMTALQDAPATTLTPFTNMTPVAISGTGTPLVTSTVNVTGLATYLYDVNLLTTLPHTFASDLDIALMSPAGTVVTLTTDNDAGSDNTFNGTLWDDDANPAGQVPYTTNAGLATDHPYVNLVTATPLAPEEALAAFIGEDPNGTWTITVSDDANLDGGTLSDWTLSLTTAECAGAPTTTTTTSTTTTTETTTSTTESTTSTTETTTSTTETTTSTTSTTVTVPPSTTTTITPGSSTSSTTSPGGATTTTTLPAGCPAGATFVSLRCRLAEMTADVQDGVEPDELTAKLLKLLGKADAGVAKAQQLSDGGAPANKVKRALKKAMKALKKIGKKLGTPAAGGIPEAIRSALLAQGSGLAADLQSLIDG